MICPCCNKKNGLIEQVSIYPEWTETIVLDEPKKDLGNSFHESIKRLLISEPKKGLEYSFFQCQGCKRIWNEFSDIKKKEEEKVE